MKKLFLIMLIAAFAVSCGKKEETQTTPPENQQQLTQQQTQTTEQTKQDESKKDELKKEDDKKKDADKKDSDKKKEEKQLTDKKEETPKEKIETKNTSDIDFAPIFAKKCAKCHGKDLKGKKDGGPDLTASKVQETADSKLIRIITNGVKAKNEDDEDMPAWKNKLTEDEIKAAVEFIKAH